MAGPHPFAPLQATRDRDTPAPWLRSQRAPAIPGAGRRWPWLVLAAILLTYIALVCWLRPAAGFGAIQDDSIYFASAKALAGGLGYVLPSFPSHLQAAKYPELFPWLLSWIWRADPRFPQNVTLAIVLTMVFGCWFLVAGFWVAKRTLGLSDGWALLATALCAFNFLALLLSGSVLSDLPFGAVALTAALAADYALEPGTHRGWMAAAGALSGLAVGMRTLGVAVVAGIFLFCVGHRAWKRAAIFFCFAAPATLPWVWPLFAHLLGFGTRSAMPTAASPGWRQTLAFYTSYPEVLRQFVPNWPAARSIILKNLLNLAADPGSYLLLPLAGGHVWLTVFGGSLISFAAWGGLFGRWRRTGWLSLFAIFPIYAAIIIPWPFPPQRFVVPFQPLLLGGFAFSLCHLTRTLAAPFRRKPTAPFSQRWIALAMAAVAVALSACILLNLAGVAPSSLTRLHSRQRALLVEQRQAYDWIRANAAPDAVFIAYDDVLLYLYTGRRAVRAIACSPLQFYTGDSSFVESDARNLTDVARQVKATYWVVTSADYAEELGAEQDAIGRRQAEWLAEMPVVFQSGQRDVRIYDLRCFQRHGDKGCPARFTPASVP